MQMRLTKIRNLAVALAMLAGTAALAPADEGMWLFTNPPRKQLKEHYGFEITDAWLEHVQKSSVRFNSGGSGSFVSEDGLVMSNHHVGADCLQKLGDQNRNYLRDGFHARTRAEEMRCHDLELNVLMSIEDVTERVNAAVKPDLSAEHAFLARRAAMAAIEKESLDRSGLRSDVVTLYQGGQYHLYRFKKYTDVRLVFAPEMQAAFFGGDPDNFEYPRFCLDVCFFRAYENGQPARVTHHLKWSASGPADNELIFVSGHPGRTSRLFTVAELEYLRDVRLPQALARLNNVEVLLSAFSARGEENTRRAKDDLFGVMNSRKAYLGEYAGILDPELLARKRAAEDRLRQAVAADARWKEAAGAWDRIASAQRAIAEHARRYNLLEGGQAFSGKLFPIARTLLRAAAERPKPNAERLREFGEAGRDSLEFELFSEEPLYDDYEQLRLANSLTWLVAQLGSGDDTVRRILGGKAPEARAAELVRATRVKSPAFRRELYNGGQTAVDAAKDPMIELARAVDAESRALRKAIETQTEAKQQAHALIARARFALEGATSYPDATFTLRLSYGVVKGYQQAGASIPPWTTFAGLYERASEQRHKPPFDLPPRWAERKSRLDLSTPYNFVSTVDIIGGNSGSPVINRQGELVGIIFDGNPQSLPWDLVFSDTEGRAISVHSRGILEGLRQVYDAHDLVAELRGGKRS